MSRRLYDEYDDYDRYEPSFEKFNSKNKKPKRKGHQSRGQNSLKSQWMKQQLSEEEIYGYDYPTPQPSIAPQASRKFTPKTSQTTPAIPNPDVPKPQHQFGPNTREIKTVKIDMDGVVAIEQIENVKDGRKTFGIKFTFAGSKGLFRIIWFNQNQYDRDKVYATEYAFWAKLKNNK